MTVYNAIPDSSIDPESPITTTLMTELRDNPIAITEAASGAPTIVTAALDMLVSSVSPSASSSQSFTINANQRYRITYRLKWSAGASGEFLLRFNSDTGIVYGWGTTTATSGNVAFISLSSGVVVNNGDYVVGSVDFDFGTDDDTDAWVFSELSRSPAGTHLFTKVEVNGHYNGASSITSVQLVAAAGDFTGDVRLFKIDG